MRIKHRWEALDQESDAIELARAQRAALLFERYPDIEKALV
jgi:hypothetical protein